MLKNKFIFFLIKNINIEKLDAIPLPLTKWSECSKKFIYLHFNSIHGKNQSGRSDIVLDMMQRGRPDSACYPMTRKYP